MIKYNLLRVYISSVNDVLHSLQKLEIELGKEAEIVLTWKAIDSLNQSIELLKDLGEERE